MLHQILSSKRKNTIRGTTVLDTSTRYAHWFYSGNWKFYDNKGKLIIERNYQSGKLASETILK
jgi:antitoxin component YwqK of YwqJK toxin-antitoxin module